MTGRSMTLLQGFARISPVSVLVAIIAAEALRGTQFELVTPAPLLLTAVACSALLGGVSAGLISFGVSVPYYTYHLWSDGPFTEEHWFRLGLIGVLAPGLIVLSAMFRPRSDSAVDSEWHDHPLFADNPVPIWVFDRDTLHFLDANDAALEQYGYALEELRELTLADIRPPDRVPELRALLEAGQRGRLHVGMQTHFRRDGSSIEVDVTADDTVYRGRPARMAVLRDVTPEAELERERERNRKRIDALARASLSITMAQTLEERLQAITDEALELIGAHMAATSLTTTGSAQFISAVSLSDRYSQWRGYDEEPDGSGIYALVLEQNRVFRMTQAELEAHPRWRGFGEYAGEHPPLNGWLAAPLKGEDGRPIGVIQVSDKYEGEFTTDDERTLMQLAQVGSAAVVLARTVEESRRANYQLEERVAERTRELAETSVRLEERNRELERLSSARGDFVTQMSHELRSPLTSVLGYAQLLEEGSLGSLSDAQLGALRDMREGGEYLLSLINDILDMARVDSGRWEAYPEPVDPLEVATRVAGDLEVIAARKGISLELETSPGMSGEVLTDRRALRQVLTNVVGNAVKFTSEGFVRVSLRLDSNWLVIDVSDSGPGIPEEALPALFDPFEVVRPAGGHDHGPSSGLGLPITRKLLQLQGGEISVASTLGQGSTFTIRLPRLPVASTID
jgi:PAS domain S-box-containing protein